MKKKIILIIASLLLALFFYILFTQPISLFKIKEVEFTEGKNLNSLLTKEELKEDIEKLIEIVENTHPIFLEKVPEKYYQAKEELLSSSNKSITVYEFQEKISKYLSSINDGHTALRWTEDSILDVKWIYKNGKLLLLDEENQATNKIVRKIGNIDIELIADKIKETFPAENYMAEAKNIAKYSKAKLLLERLGVKTGENINLTIENNDLLENMAVEFVNSNNTKNRDYSIYAKKLEDNIAYIKLEICEVNLALERVLKDIESYLKEGVKNFIIDLSDNPGGNSLACSKILEALNMKAGKYTSVIRFSPLAQEQRGYLRRRGSIRLRGSNKVVKNQDINLYLLTNENTFSSAQMFAVFVRDGNLGTIIGRASSNSPSSYGDIIQFQLENSKLIGQVSHKKWIRPDISKEDEKVLEPDIYVDYGEDLLERALKEIK
ncbi:S41 family peptidase [Caproiciproducens sp. MSJ-32]|uniref:S41 family peptidase n=1 Tax=Caproiciproducens sp. MSJ-32 TaxID=2841527 RepID=UPI001C119BC0|nr:S41 family peptidase [Caproiciproducens sp. MSJ-32]MBU5455400.1 S41 family peptidase [Caproiciproducens sp. MSJ-32]